MTKLKAAVKSAKQEMMEAVDERTLFVDKVTSELTANAHHLPDGPPAHMWTVLDGAPQDWRVIATWTPDPNIVMCYRFGLADTRVHCRFEIRASLILTGFHPSIQMPGLDIELVSQDSWREFNRKWSARLTFLQDALEALSTSEFTAKYFVKQ